MSKESDEWEVFGAFVASELRSLSDAKKQKKMKRAIQQVILNLTEDDTEQI